MKKRTIVSIFLTLLLCALFYKFYVIGHSFKIDLFLALLILSFLFCYKISDYLADFKINKSASRLDIVFLVLFFIMLLIPSCHINTGNVSKLENKKLEPYKPLFNQKGLNLTYGKDFENWYKDRFYFKKQFVDVSRKIKLLNRYITEKDVYGDKVTKYFIFDFELKRLMYQISEDGLNKTKESLLKFKQFTDENNIDLYVFVAPQDFMIYPEFLPDFVNKNLVYKTKTQGFQIRDALKDSGIQFYYLYDQIYKHKDDEQLLYYKSDNHMTDTGMYYTYLAIIDILNQKYNGEFKPINLKDYKYIENNRVNFGVTVDANTVGNQNLRTVNSEKYLDKTYKHYLINQEPKDYIRLNKEPTLDEITVENPLLDKKLFMIGSSYTYKLMKFMKSNFKSVYRLQANEMVRMRKTYPDIYQRILDFKPDIIILFFNEAFLQYFITTMYDLKGDEPVE